MSGSSGTTARYHEEARERKCGGDPARGPLVLCRMHGDHEPRQLVGRRCPHRAAAQRAEDSPPYLAVQGKPARPCVRALGSMNPSGNPKRRRAGALQNLSAVRVTLANAPASWSAAVLRRFRCEHALEIRAVQGKPLSFFRMHGDHEPRQLVGRGVLTAPRPGGLRTARPTSRPTSERTETVAAGFNPRLAAKPAPAAADRRLKAMVLSLGSNVA